MQPKRCDTYLVQLAWVSFEMKQNNLHTHTYIKLEKGMKSIESRERNNIDWCLTKKLFMNNKNRKGLSLRQGKKALGVE